MSHISQYEFITDSLTKNIAEFAHGMGRIEVLTNLDENQIVKNLLEAAYHKGRQEGHREATAHSRECLAKVEAAQSKLVGLFEHICTQASDPVKAEIGLLTAQYKNQTNN